MAAGSSGNDHVGLTGHRASPLRVRQAARPGPEGGGAAARTIATMPAWTASGSSGQAAITIAKPRSIEASALDSASLETEIAVEWGGFRGCSNPGRVAIFQRIFIDATSFTPGTSGIAPRGARRI